jgi:hypothetical protein
MRKLPPYILTNPNSGRHLYKRGWLGLIPLVGAIVGIGLVILGLVRYKDKKLVLIGSAAILFTVIIYGSIFYYGAYSEAGGKQVAGMSETLLNDLVKNVEFYKIKNGSYPDSLEQLTGNNDLTIINDPLLSRRPGAKTIKFNYKKIGPKYTLFSSGLDRIANTSDDIYPTVTLPDSSKFGLIKQR